MEIVRALDECGGAARWNELLTAGVSERALVRAVREGRVERLGHGTYALPSALPEVGFASLFQAKLGCLTACVHWGMPLWEAARVPHVVLPRGRSESRRAAHELARVVAHRTSAKLSGGVWVPLAQAVDQAGWCTSPVGQLVIVDAALNAGVLQPRDVAHFEQRDARRRGWLRRMASGAAESPPETVARVAMVMAGLAVREQVTFPGVGRVDFVVEGVLVVEIDGWAFHSGRDAFESDRARDRHLLMDGIPVMRFTAKQVRSDPAAMARAVAAVVGRKPRARFEDRMRWALENVRVGTSTARN